MDPLSLLLMIGVPIVLNIIDNVQKADASTKATAAQTEASNAAIAAQKEQFEAMKADLQPYSDAGEKALIEMQTLSGDMGDEAQQTAIDKIRTGSEFGAMIQQGENAILQNASATGGLRGGNTQGALAQFRPAVLNSLIDKRMGQLGGLTSLGQNAAAGVGNAGMNMASNTGNLMQSQGQAQAQNIMNQTAPWSAGLSGASNLWGVTQGYGGFPTNTTTNTTSVPNYGGGGSSSTNLTQSLTM